MPWTDTSSLRLDLEQLLRSRLAIQFHVSFGCVRCWANITAVMGSTYLVFATNGKWKYVVSCGACHWRSNGP